MTTLTAVFLFAFPAAAWASDAPAAQPAAAPAPKAALPTEEAKTLYALGLAVGRNLGTFDLSAAEMKYVEMGLRDAALGKEPKVELPVYGPKLEDLQKGRMSRKSEREKAKAKPFLDKAAKEPGALKLPSGVIYRELKAGTGESPKASDKVKVHYHGTLTDGKVFDSSVQRGEPAEFPLGGVIPCWTEGVQKMKVGGKAKLVCPAAAAYGDRGAPPVIAGGATLVFEVELLDILKPEAPAPEKPETKAFLDEAAKEAGAVKLPSGVVYRELKAGKGESPKATDKVKVHYHGTLPDGKVFDSSVERKEPAEFPLNGVIPCWTEGVQKMKVGGKAKLVCPAATAYGDRGAPPDIRPGATLVFEVELLDILK